MKQVLVISSLNAISPANYLIDSLIELGCKVIAISDVDNPRAYATNYGAFDVEKFVSKHHLEPDVMLFVEGGEMGIFPVNHIKLGCPKVWWGIDTHNDYEKHLRVSRLFDHSFIAQKSYVEVLIEDGISSVSWLPLAYPQKKLTKTKRDYDLAYVGSTNWQLYPERKNLIEAITMKFDNCFVGECSPREMFNIYENSKIVFNFSPLNDLNMRFFEATGSGALLVTNKILNNGVESVLTEGQDYLVFSDSKDLNSKLEFYLGNPDQLEKISKAGSFKIRQNHTYLHRAREILDKQYQFSNRSYGYFDELVALSSFGMISASIEHFFLSMNSFESGKRNQVICMIVRPLFYVATKIARLIEHIAVRQRKHKW